MTNRRAPLRPSSVSNDWLSKLAETHSDVYKCHVPKLEAAYSMLSVSLDEAIGLHNGFRDKKANEAVCVTNDLCLLLTVSLEDLLHSMLLHIRHSAVVPNTTPLNSENFRGSRAQRTARKNALLSRVLLSQRSQFLHKMTILEELVDDLGKDFSAAAEELSSGDPFEPQRNWEFLNATHYDLNTCFRESIVLFKSFLIALPEAQIQDFQHTVQLQTACHEECATSIRSIRHRRIPAIAAQ